MILMNDFRLEPASLKEEMNTAIRGVLDSGWYVLGNEVTAFENEWAEICGTKYAVGVANGMDAIEIILRALEIGEGDEVITTPITAFATVLAIIRAGATPVLADINPDTGLLSQQSVSRCISSKTKAVLLVHLYGNLYNPSSWVSFCKSNNIHLIEDCAQSHIARAEGKNAGSFGIAAAFSFYPTKNLGAPGDAGMIVTCDKNVAERSKTIRNYGQSKRYHHPVIGLNSRLDEIHAAILRVRLKYLHQFTDRRIQITERYRCEIKNAMVTFLDSNNELFGNVCHLFVVLSENRDLLQKYLDENGVSSLIHYPVPIHFQEPCLTLARDPNGLKYSEVHANKCLSIPCHPQMTDDEVSFVINILNNYK